jgi:penicillin-binding protein 1B
MARSRLKSLFSPRVALLLAASVGLLVFSVYLVTLDAEVRGRFAGARWALPAQVYAAPLEIYPGYPLDLRQFRHEMERLGYRGVRQADRPGSFALGDNHIDVYTRAFVFWDGAQAPVRVRIRFADNRIAEILDQDLRHPRALLRLDPLLVGSIYPAHGEDRILVRLDQVPELLPAGLLHVEDRNFEGHFGLDPKGIVRALIANLRAGRAVQGGSTITQQLVKNFFLSNERSWRRKVNEALMAVLLEVHYSKDEILEAYLNEVHLGQDGGRAVHGFGLASQFYFNKPLTELQSQEIALLIAMVKGPSFYNPRRNAERAQARRDLVLAVLSEAGYLTPQELEQAREKPLGVTGQAGGRVERYPAFVDLVKRQLRGQYRDSDLTHEGLRIFTTLEPRTQEALEQRLLEGIPVLEKRNRLPDGSLEGAGVVSSVEGGEVLALVGGRDVRFPGFNRALDARRPIGSLVKPFVYLTALTQPQRYSLTSYIDDEPVELLMPHGAVWMPENYDRESYGSVPLHLALAKSLNLATVHLGLDVGVALVRDTLRAAGMLGEPLLLPSMFLGALEMSPLEVARVYGTLAASGYQSPLLAIREVQTQEGQPLSRYPLRVRKTLPEGPVYLINWALERVMTAGTGVSAYNFLPSQVRVAGKTGTTSELRDSWFAGFGQDRVAVIWLGRDDNEPAGLTGASGALQVWAPLMRDLRVQSLSSDPPADVVEVLIDPETGRRANESCPQVLAVPYLQGYAPTEYAPCAGMSTPFRWFRRRL